MPRYSGDRRLSRRSAIGTLSAVGLAGACRGQGQPDTGSKVTLTDFIDKETTDHSTALQRAIEAGHGCVYIPDGIYFIDQVAAANVRLFGQGTLRKKPRTKGVMLYLSGRNRIEGITLDYDWPNAESSPPYVNNVALYQKQGELRLIGVQCRRSFYAAVYVEGGSLNTDSNCSFIEGIPHNDLKGAAARLSHYIICVSDEATHDQTIIISGGKFVGSSLDKERLHLNPTGIFITPDRIDGNRFDAISIANTTLIGCSTNCGDGNITGAIDIYNGAKNIVISGLTIRLFSYAAIKIQNSSNFNISGNVISEGHVPVGAFVKQSCACVTTQKVRGSVVKQANGIIARNTMSDLYYAAIINSCDCVIISQNVINGVTYNKMGNAIENSGDSVSILDNVATNIEGYQISCTGNRCRIEGNNMDSGATAGRGGLVFTGAGTAIQRNRFRSGMPSGGSGIRTDGPASDFDISGNVTEGFPYGVDIRATAGAVGAGTVDRNTIVGKGMPLNLSPAFSSVRSGSQ